MRRRALAALGVFAAAVVVGTGATVGYSLATGFARSAEQAGLPDVIARFSTERRSLVDARVRALPNLAARSYRNEQTNWELGGNGHITDSGALDIVLGGRRGYHVVAGHDLHDRRSGEVVVERGLADAWGLHVGGVLDVARLGELQIVGIAVSPDNVAYPLAKAARVYVTQRQIQDRFGIHRPLAPNMALLWLHDPAKADVTLTQARAVSFGLGRLEFITREGVRICSPRPRGS